MGRRRGSIRPRGVCARRELEVRKGIDLQLSRLSYRESWRFVEGPIVVLEKLRKGGGLGGDEMSWPS